MPCQQNRWQKGDDGRTGGRTVQKSGMSCSSTLHNSPSLSYRTKENRQHVCASGWVGRSIRARFHPSCLGWQDSWLIDYQATKNSLEVGKAAGASHFVLLSGEEEAEG